MERLRRFFEAYKWPLFITGLLLMPIVANAFLVYHATHGQTPRIEPNYYEQSLKWDETQAKKELSNRLGWTVAYDLPQGPQYEAGLPRPVDVVITDRNDRPVTGLEGSLLALRPSDTSMNNEGALVELPHLPGHYRALLRFPGLGIWEFTTQARRGSESLTETRRVFVKP